MTGTDPIPHWSNEDLSGLSITAQDVIESIESLVRASQSGSAWSAPKAVISPPDARYIMATLAAMDDPPLVATKSLVQNERNSDIGLPQINSLVTLLHGQTGVPVATMDGNWITAVRTAGLSAVAAKYMANPSASSIGFIGTGIQARSHLQLFAEMFPLSRAKVLGRGRKNIDALCQAASGLGLASEVCATAQETVTDVDLVVTSVTHTGVSEPFIDAEWLSSGCFAAIVDLAVPWHTSSFAALDCLIVDDLAQEAALENKLANAADVHGDLSELVMNKVKGRSHPDDRTAFVFRGHALGDLALSALAYRRFNA